MTRNLLGVTIATILALIALSQLIDVLMTKGSLYVY